MLDKVKTALRISHSALDDDIQSNIDACSLDLRRVGINPLINDALMESAVLLYCKGVYDFGGKGEQYRRLYERLRDALSMCEEYAGNV